VCVAVVVVAAGAVFVAAVLVGHAGEDGLDGLHHLGVGGVGLEHHDELVGLADGVRGGHEGALVLGLDGLAGDLPADDLVACA
jgi:hypothetical protein